MVGPSDCAGPARPVPFFCQCRWPRLCREPEPMGTPTGRCLVPPGRVPPGTQVPNGSQRTVNGPLTANGRIPPLTVNPLAEPSWAAAGLR